MWRIWLISSSGIFGLLYRCWMKRSFCERRLRKLAAVFVVLSVLGCYMFHLEHRFNQEAFRIAVVSAKRQHLADYAAVRLPLDMDDEINSFSDLRFGIGECSLRVATHDQIGETAKGLLCRVGMNGRQRTCMASVEGIQQRSRLDSTHFAENDPVGSEAKCVLQ